MTKEERKEWQDLMKLLMRIWGCIAEAQETFYQIYKVVDEKLDGKET